MKDYILAIDQGTTGTTVALIDRHAKLVCAVDREHPQIYPHPGWVEHDAETIWRSVVTNIVDVLAKANVPGDQIAAIGITNQRETVVAWDAATGHPVANAIVWQCRRTTEFCTKLKTRPEARLIRQRTGLLIDPYFSASKMKWLLEHTPGLRRRAAAGAVKFGTIDSFLLWRLTGGQSHRTDVSNASRTQLMNLRTMRWDRELLKIFRVPLACLPEIVASNSEFGRTRGVPGLPDGLPIHGIAGDQQAALFGQTCFDVGMAKCSFGTGSFLLMNTGTKRVSSRCGLLTTAAWQLTGEDPVYALEGGAFVCGAAVQWLRDQMGFIATSAEVETLAAEVDSTEGVYLIPAFVGLGAPYWDPDARAALVGMTRGTTRAHVARATLEAMALQNVDILEAMERDLGRRMKTVRVDGGAAADDLLMQMQADFLGGRVQRPREIESTTMGAAFLAGLGVGLWKDRAELQKVWAMEREFTPALGPKARAAKLKAWRREVARVMGK